MVSNIYIDEVLRKFNNFLGTFSSDNIPKLSENQGVICNFSKEREEGTHFIFLFFSKNKLYYFDSLKLGIIPDDIHNYISNYPFFMDISRSIQHNSSSFCGFYCILAFIACNIKIDFFLNDVLPVFNDKSLENDKICVKLINRLFWISSSVK